MATVRSSRRVVALSATTTLAAALLGVGSAVVVLPEVELPPRPSPAQPVVTAHPPVAALHDDLRAPSARWAAWTDGAPARAHAAPGPAGLELSLDARGSDAGRVHAVGVISSAIDVGAGRRVEARLDWRAPTNACYRAAGLGVVAAAVDPTAVRLADLLAWVEVTGVPPGRTARRFAAVRAGPHPDAVFTDGWPGERAGRAIERTTLSLSVQADQASFAVDGQPAGRAAAPLGRAIRIVLFLTSHANFPPRPVTFEQVSVEPVAPEVVAQARRRP